MKPVLGVTTTIDRFEQLAPELDRLGLDLDLVSLPCIKIELRPEVLNDLYSQGASTEAIVLSSARAASLIDFSRLDSIPVLAVGPRTAASAKQAGAQVTWTGSGGMAELATEAGRWIKSRRVLVVGASNRLQERSRSLEKAGASVTSVPLYTTLAIAPPKTQIEGVIFGSPTAVEGWYLSRDLRGLQVAVLGQEPAQSVRSRGVTPDLISTIPSFVSAVTQLTKLIQSLPEEQE